MRTETMAGSLRPNEKEVLPVEFENALRFTVVGMKARVLDLGGADALRSVAALPSSEALMVLSELAGVLIAAVLWLFAKTLLVPLDPTSELPLWPSEASPVDEDVLPCITAGV